MTDAGEPAPTAADVAGAAREALGPEVRLLASLDSAGFAGSLGEVGAALALGPAAVAKATLALRPSIAGEAAPTGWTGCSARVVRRPER